MVDCHVEVQTRQVHADLLSLGQEFVRVCEVEAGLVRKVEGVDHAVNCRVTAASVDLSGRQGNSGI